MGMCWVKQEEVCGLVWTWVAMAWRRGGVMGEHSREREINTSVSNHST